jgi:hypothetical protein
VIGYKAVVEFAVKRSAIIQDDSGKAAAQKFASVKRA